MKAIYAYSNITGGIYNEFYAHIDERIVVLTGRVPVNTENQRYIDAETIYFKFGTNTFPFERSEVATAYLCAFNEGERIYAVPVRARIVSRSRIEVEKVDAYDNYSHDVELYFASGFVVLGDETLQQPHVSQKYTFKSLPDNRTISMLGCHNLIEEDWGFLSFMFEWLSGPANTDFEIAIEGLPTDAECDVLVFLAASSNYAGPGCRVAKGRIENGKLLVHNESEYEIYSARSYVQIFFTRVKRYAFTFNGYSTEYFVEGERIKYPTLPQNYWWTPYPMYMPDHDLYGQTFYSEEDLDL